MRATLLAYIRLPHFVPIVAVLVATAGFAAIIGREELSAGELAMLVLALLGGQIVVGVVNELVDAPVDALTKPDKPIPAGLVTRRGAAILGSAGLLLMVVAGASLGMASFGLLLFGTGMGVAYSLWFKRTSFAWLPYFVALPLLPVWVAVTLDRFDAGLLALYVLGAPGVLAVQLAQSVPDVDADLAAGINSLSTRLGEPRALRLCWGTLVTSLALATAAAALTGIEGMWLATAAAIGIGAVGLNILVYRRAPRTGVMLAFPCTVVAVSALALAWVSMVTG